ncbi:MAG TPA: hypothetical protein VJ179_03040 [Patescibacteria group bacterium]|nr:hypothetical protein [Patescibacteria group bacterium]
MRRAFLLQISHRLIPWLAVGMSVCLLLVWLVFRQRVQPQASVSLSSSNAGIHILVQADEKEKNRVLSFFDKKGPDEQNLFSGFDIEFDASTTAEIKSHLPLTFDLGISGKELTATSPKNYTAFQSIFSLFEDEFVPREAYYSPKRSLFLISGIGLQDILSYLPHFTKEQSTWMKKLEMGVGGKGVLIAVKNHIGLEYAYLVSVKDNNDILTSLWQLKEVEFDTPGGVLGYSEKNEGDTVLYQSFLNAFYYKGVLVLATTPTLADEILELVKGTRNDSLATDETFRLTLRKVPEPRFLLYISHPQQFLGVNDRYISLAFAQEFPLSEDSISWISALLITSSRDWILFKIVK